MRETSLRDLMRSWKTPAAFSVAAVIVVMFAGCLKPKQGPVIPPRIWSAGVSEAIAPDGTPPEGREYHQAGGTPITLRGAPGERVAFQFVVQAEDASSSGLRIRADDLVGAASSVPASAVHVFRQWPVSVERFPNWYLKIVGSSRPRDFPDALIPIDAPRYGQPYTLTRGSSLSLWVEVEIPPSARVGRYQGGLVVADADATSIRTPLELEVVEVAMSKASIPILARVQIAPIVTAFTDVDPENPRLVLENADSREAIKKTFMLLQAHGLSPYSDDFYPPFRQGLDGGVNLDWAAYDAFCGQLIDGSAYRDGRPSAAWPLPIDLNQPDPSEFGGLGSTGYAAVLKDYLTAVVEHFEQKGWSDRSFVFFDLPRGDNPKPEDLEHVKRIATLTHMVRPGLSFVTRLIPQSMGPFGWSDHHHEDLTSIIDIWSTPARYQHGPTLKRLQTLGKRTWLLPDRPPYSGSMAVEAPPVHARSLAWQAYLQGHDAIVIDHTTAWPDGDIDEPIRDRDQPSDSWLVYPGTAFGLDEPIASVRLKRLQLGLQDYRRLKLLEDHGRSETAKLVAGSLVKAAGTDAYGDNYQDGLFRRRVDDASLWQLARGILDEELVAVVQTGDTVEPGGGAKKTDWSKLLNATRGIEVWPEPGRVRVDDRPKQTGYLVTYEISVRSELRTPVEGELRFGPLPPTAKSVSDIVRVGPVKEMGLARQKLVASFPALPGTDMHGHALQELIFDGGSSGHLGINATASVVQAPRAQMSLTIDGKLDDWGPSIANAAGDFRLITSRQGIGAERKPAVDQTVAYFSRDDRYLYIGVHAFGTPPDPSDAARRSAFRNFVEYEDLRPVGEDLVEILIDPSNTGTLTDDLYHIVLKSSGNPLFERGVRMDPPIGQVRAWPGIPPSSAVLATADGWAAEIAIPFATFDEDELTSRVWGINLARLSPKTGEYSDWARVPRHCYDPRTLGNLVLHE